MSKYTIENRFSRVRYSQTIEAAGADEAYAAYAADCGDFCNSDDEPFDRDDLILTEVASFAWRTDAASGEIEAVDADAAVEKLIAQNEWAALDSAREEREIADGAWLTIFDAGGLSILTRGQMP